VEEVVLSVQLLFIVSESAAPLAELIDRLLHLSTFELWETLVPWSRLSGGLRVHIVTLELEKLVLEKVVLLIGRLHSRLRFNQLVLEPLDLLLRLLL